MGTSLHACKMIKWILEFKKIADNFWIAILWNGYVDGEKHSPVHCSIVGKKYVLITNLGKSILRAQMLKSMFF